MGRALIADPHLPNKAKEGRFDEINYCMSCNRCHQTMREGALRCAVNPEAGNEDRFKVSKSVRPKKVWIIGGGPGGLKAAEIAAMGGHRVTVFERSHKLGGRMRSLSPRRPPRRVSGLRESRRLCNPGM
jgi:2,4-dienoyl-CoA reductase (NADPH2)